MLSIAVVDDEQAFSDTLIRMIRQFAAKENVEVEITCFQDGLDIADEFRSKWDIIFLDIQMEHLDGLAAARRIRACDTDVVLIFVTTMAQYAINGYEVDAFDYILKPLSYPQFELRMLKAGEGGGEEEGPQLCLSEEIQRRGEGLHRRHPLYRSGGPYAALCHRRGDL